MTKVILEYEQITGIFKEENLNSVVLELERRNVDPSQISVLMSQTTGDQLLKINPSTKAPEGATVGGITGGLLGALIGGLTLAGTVLLPGVGLLAAGPLVGALAGTSIGVASGGLLGALIGLGLPEHEAKEIENTLKEPGTVLVMAEVPKEQVSEIKALFQRFEVKGMKVTSH